MEDSSVSTNTIKCEQCEAVLKKDHSGVRCESSHHLCKDCSESYINSMMSAPAQNIPCKCSFCKCHMISNYIEMNLKAEDVITYLMYVATTQAGSDEKIENCPFCKYYEIWSKKCTSNYFYCKLEGCKKGSCSICHKDFKLPKSETSITAEEEKQMFGKDGMFSHLECYEYKDLKAEWDQAIANGNQRFCPECGLGGMKDDACTHITCAKCGCVYCYVCGIDEKNLDKSDSKGDIYKHNDDWKINEKRCPQWFHSIKYIDSRWKGLNNTECVLFFHKLLTYRNIKALIDKHGIEKLSELREVFEAVANQDYDLDEVKNMDLTIIKIN